MKRTQHKKTHKKDVGDCGKARKKTIKSSREREREREREME